MDTATLARALACLDLLTPRHAHRLGVMLSPDRQFNTQQAAGAAVRPILAELARQGMARRNPQGWVRRQVPDSD